VWFEGSALSAIVEFVGMPPCNTASRPGMPLHTLAIIKLPTPTTGLARGFLPFASYERCSGSAVLPGGVSGMSSTSLWAMRSMSTPMTTRTTPTTCSRSRRSAMTATASMTPATGSMLATMLALLASMCLRATIEMTKATVPGRRPIKNMSPHASVPRGASIRVNGSARRKTPGTVRTAR